MSGIIWGVIINRTINQESANTAGWLGDSRVVDPIEERDKEMH